MGTPSQLAAFRDNLRRHPGQYRLGYRVQARWEGIGARATCQLGTWTLGGQIQDSRTYTLALGTPRRLEEALGIEPPTDRLDPVEVVLGALAVSVAATVALGAQGRDLALTGVSVTAHTTIDPSPLFGARAPEELPQALGSIQVTVTVHGDLEPTASGIIERLVRGAPVFGLLGLPMALHTTVIVQRMLPTA